MTTTADADLVKVMASAVAGDEIAFGRIVAAYEPEMHRICVAVSRDHAIAADVRRAGPSGSSKRSPARTMVSSPPSRDTMKMDGFRRLSPRKV